MATSPVDQPIIAVSTPAPIVGVVQANADAKERFLDELKDFLPTKVSCPKFDKTDPEFFAKKIDNKQPGFLAAVRPWMQMEGVGPLKVHSWVIRNYREAVKARKRDAAKALLQEWGVE